MRGKKVSSRQFTRVMTPVEPPPGEERRRGRVFSDITKGTRSFRAKPKWNKSKRALYIDFFLFSFQWPSKHGTFLTFTVFWLFWTRHKTSFRGNVASRRRRNKHTLTEEQKDRHNRRRQAQHDIGTTCSFLHAFRMNRFHPGWPSGATSRRPAGGATTHPVFKIPRIRGETKGHLDIYKGVWTNWGGKLNDIGWLCIWFFFFSHVGEGSSGEPTEQSSCCFLY